MSVTPEEIEHRFGYHRATFPADWDGDDDPQPLRTWIGTLDKDGNRATAPSHALVRHQFQQLARKMLVVVPEGREQALMLTALQEAAMWASAGIAMEAPLIRE